ncbi:MAG: hypothetical protein ABIJ97_05975 [Bacteroidota bacterium]
MKKYFLITLFLIQCLQIVFAREKIPPDSTYLKKSISINLSQLAFRDIRISYEWPWKKNRLLNAGLGYKFGIQGNQYSMDQFLNKHTLHIYPIELKEQEWFYFTFGNSWYINNSFLNLFIDLLSIDLLFRYAYHDLKYYIWQVTQEESSYISLKSLERIAAGIKCTTGKKYFMKISDKYTSYIEIYAGCGIRYHYIEWTIYARKDGYVEIEDLVAYDTPLKDVINGIAPTVHIGICIGLAFGK